MKPFNTVSACMVLALAACTPQIQPASSMESAAAAPDTMNVADAAIAGGDPAMALSVSQSVLQSDPNDVDAMIHEGDAYYALQRCPDAIAAYRLALQADAGSSQAQTGLGRCLLKTDPKTAEAALSLAVQDDPGNAAALDDLGIARDLQGNFAGAIDPYQRALLAQPGCIAAEVNLGLSLALSGNAAQALQYLGPLATGPDATPKIRENYAAALIASGRGTEARQVLGVDLPPDQVDRAMAGFISVLANAQHSLSVGENDAPPAITVTNAATIPAAAQALNGRNDRVAGSAAPSVSPVLLAGK
jgi:Flp pilus assembly protein TadD